MEACKGGTLAEIPEEAQRLMKDYNPDASIASWAYRFVGSLPGVRVVLAGMPKMEFFEDDLKTFENFEPLNEEEYAIIDKVVDIINENTAIPCTVCRYCESQCPNKIPIPDCFSLYNDMKRLEKSSAPNAVMTQGLLFGSLMEKDYGLPSSCIECKKCMKVCPQHLDIPKYLRECVVPGIEKYDPSALISQEAD